MSSGSVFDIITVAVLLVSAGIAFFRGFIREVLTILGVVGGLAAAFFGGPLLAPLVRGWMGVKSGAGAAAAKAGEQAPEQAQALFGVIPYTLVADALAYGGIFIVVVIVLSVVSHLLSGWAKAVGLGAVDRTLGVVFGLARGAVLLALLYLPVYLLVEQSARATWFQGSRTSVYVESAAAFAAARLPQSVTADIEKKAAEQAGAAAETAREKLQELDVLQGGKTSAPAPAAESGEGYDGGQRESLDHLIKDSTNE